MNDSARKYVVVILGPTAVGKSACGIRLSQTFGGEIVSADSRQFYRGISIGTAKPSEAELGAVPHHFVDSLALTENYTAGHFEKDALETIRKLHEENKLPVVVGGSGLYIKALLDGLDSLPANEEIREAIAVLFLKDGLEGLQEEVKKRDPEYFRKVDQNNHARLIRALEILRSTGESMAANQSAKPKTRPFHAIKIGLDLDRETLYRRINARVDQMIRDGLVEEARSVIAHRHVQALQTVGYQELFAHFDGETDLATAVELIKRNSRRYAKRQLTWLRKEQAVNWFPCADHKAIDHFVENQFAE